jgi:hypothetical protein
MTNDHIAMLKWIKESENPNWVFLIQNFPPGYLWDTEKVSHLIGELESAKMIHQEDAEANIVIRKNGEARLKQALDNAEKEELKNQMTYEQLFLSVKDLQNKVLDYDEIKLQSKKAFQTSLVSAVIGLISLGVAIFRH